MLEFIFTPQFIVAAVVFSLAGGFVGIGLGRRSATANAYYDAALARADEVEARLRAEVQDLRDRLGK